MDEPDGEDKEEPEKKEDPEKSPLKRKSTPREAPTQEGGGDGIKLSDVFLNMNLDQDKGKKVKNGSKADGNDEDDEVDFERDED